MYAYTELKSRFDRSSNPNKTEYKLENNTYVQRRDNFLPIDFNIILHGSIIAQITQDKIVLDSCGYRTMTTKDRLNKILSDNNTGYTIYQVNHVWQVHKDSIPWGKESYKFADGITFIYEINCKMGNGWEVSNYADDNTKEINQLKSKITKYVNQFYTDFTQNKIPVPSGADCWYCSLFKDTDNPDNTHLLNHIEESYFVPSLLVNAVKSTPQSIMSNNLMACWINQDQENFKWLINVVGYQIKKSLYNYMIKNLITNT